MIFCASPKLSGPQDPARPGGWVLGSLEALGAYCADGQPHLEVAEDDDTERDDTARDHQDDHVGLHPWVRAATEHVWAARRLQAMGPVPAEKGWQPVLMQAGWHGNPSGQARHRPGWQDGWVLLF